MITRLQAAYDDSFHPDQSHWLDVIADSSFTAILGGRQIGKDHAVSGGLVGLDAVVGGSPRWNCYSGTRDLAEEFLDSVKQWIAYWSHWLKVDGYAVPVLEVNNQQRVKLSNGARVYSYAATERGAVGKRGNVFINEAGVIPDFKRLYEALEPVVSGAIYNGHDAKMVIASNASWVGSPWYNVWHALDPAQWATITTTWYDHYKAVGWSEEQLQTERARIIARVGLGAYRQWYDCQWRSADESFFSPAILDRQSVDTSDLMRQGSWKQTIGYDIGRHTDPAAFAPVVSRTDGGSKTRGQWYGLPVQVLHQTPFRAQRVLLQTLVDKRRTVATVIDKTGMGEAPAESAQRKLRNTRVVPFNVSGPSKVGLFSTLKAAYDDGWMHLPLGDLDLRMEIEGITAGVTKSGNVTIDYPRTRDTAGRVSHGDRAFAHALGVWGAAEHGSSILDAMRK